MVYIKPKIIGKSLNISKFTLTLVTLYIEFLCQNDEHF